LAEVIHGLEESDGGRFFQTLDDLEIGVVEDCNRHGFALEASQGLGVSARSSGSTLMATSRFSVVSRARYTSPIPPAPSCSMIL
jgi:hypothetical protein